MQQRAIFPGRYVQGRGALDELSEEVSRLGRSALIVAGRTAHETIIPGRLQAWREQFDVKVELFGGECSHQEIERLSQVAGDLGSEVVIGMGGGKTIDTAKAVSHSTGSWTVIVPTIASTDAPTSAVSVIYTSDGTFEGYLFQSRNPDLVLVDTDIIARAPVRFLVAGMGDALATWFEADSCRRSSSPSPCGGLGTRAAYALARLCYDTILEHGVSARVACQQDVVTAALSHVVEANTLLSGLGFESGGLGAAHSIHNGLTRLSGTHHFYHGEKVAFGVQAGLFLTDRSRSTIETVYDFCESVELPTTLSEIGLGEASNADLRQVAEGACAEGETIHNETGTIRPEMVSAALKTADGFGRLRKGTN